MGKPSYFVGYVGSTRYRPRRTGVPWAVIIVALWFGGWFAAVLWVAIVHPILTAVGL